MTIEFFHECTIPTITAQQRRQNTKGGYQQDRLRTAKAFWLAVTEKFKPEKPLSGAIELTVQFNFPHTKASSKKGVVVPKLTKPDTDNLVKLVKDAMTKNGYWNDDAQVFDEHLQKFNSEIPGVFIRVKQYGIDNTDTQ